MTIEDALKNIAQSNGFYRLDFGIRHTVEDDEVYYTATAWGLDIGEYECTSSQGSTVKEAIANVVTHAAELRAARLPVLTLDGAA